MKHQRIISLMLALCLVLLLAGCGAASSGDTSESTPKQTPENEVRDTITGLLDNLVAGDSAKAQKYCAEEIRDDEMFSEFFDPDDVDSAYEYLGISEEAGISPDLLNEETEESVLSFIRTFNENIFRDYEITELSVDGDTATATAHVNYGIDPEEISAKDPSELVSEEEQDAIFEEHSEEIEEAMINEGEEAAMAILYNALLPVMMDAMSEYISTGEGSEEDWDITLTKTGDKWEITSIQGV